MIRIEQSLRSTKWPELLAQMPSPTFIYTGLATEEPFEGSDPSEPVRVAIEREVERLEKHNRHIIGCHVAVIAPSHKHRHGSGFRVHISLTVSPHENVIVNHAPADDSRCEHVEVGSQ